MTLNFLLLRITNVVSDKEKVKDAELYALKGYPVPIIQSFLREIHVCARTSEDTLPKDSLQDGN